MSELKPLLDGSLAPELAEMLRSAELDEPTDVDRRERRLLAVLGASAGTPSAAPSVPASGIERLVSTAKWGVPLLMVIAGGAIALSSGWSARPAPPPRAATPAEVAPTASPAATAANGAAALSAIDAPSAAVRVEDLPSVANPPAPREPAPRASGAPAQGESSPATPAAIAPSPTIADELAVIDAARAALAAGRPADALSRTQGYRTAFATPHFSDEADTLEIQALAALGRAAEARAKAESFVAAHPSSPYVQRVRSAAGLNAPSPL